MGSRAAVGLANEICESDESYRIKGVVCLSYPLHTERDKVKMRDEPIKALNLPSLFVSGTNDAMCDKEKLEKILSNCPKANIKWIEDADHSCKVKGKKEADVLEDINKHVVSWCKENINSHGEVERGKGTNDGKDDGYDKNGKRKRTKAAIQSSKGAKKLKR